jgi:putative thiamine transport system ATP-binding protein
LLLDEPFSKLDTQLRDSVRELVFSEVKRRALPTLLVTHDSRDAEAAGGSVIAL